MPFALGFCHEIRQCTCQILKPTIQQRDSEITDRIQCLQAIETNIVRNTHFGIGWNNVRGALESFIGKECDVTNDNTKRKVGFDSGHYWLCNVIVSKTES